jgi:hypothetical protein
MSDAEDDIIDRYIGRIRRRPKKRVIPPGTYNAQVESITQNADGTLNFKFRTETKQENEVVNTVKCAFQGTPYKTYDYLTNRSDIQKGDTVVVMAPGGNPTCVTVVDVLYNTKTSRGFKYIVDKVDFDDYNKVQQQIEAQRQLERQRAHERAKLEKALEARRMQVKNELLRKAFAEDPMITELEASLRRLDGKNTEDDESVILGIVIG